MKHFYRGRIGKTYLTYCFKYPETCLYFHHFLDSADHESFDIKVTESDFNWAQAEWNMAINANLEYILSLYRTSDYLTRDNSCLFHGASFLWNKKAYLISADSGVGKTTQIRNWMALYSNEIRIMNGDKPVLCLEKDDQINVFPSPWKGKEEWGDDRITAPLGGVILLKQGKSNSIKRIDSIGYGARMMSYFFSTFENAETVRKLCRIEEAIWQSVPVWLLTNKGDLESAMITHNAMLEAING